MLNSAAHDLIRPFFKQLNFSVYDSATGMIQRKKNCQIVMLYHGENYIKSYLDFI